MPPDLAPLETVVQRILARWRPVQVWLFGSRARGEALPSSDWDLLVVLPDDTPDAELDPLVGWNIQKGSGVRADVLTCRRSDFLEDKGTPNTLAFDAAVEGILVYERE